MILLGAETFPVDAIKMNAFLKWVPVLAAALTARCFSRTGDK